MKAYDTLSQAVEDLKTKGYTYDFKLVEDGVVCNADGLCYAPDHFDVVEMHRFEGMSSAGDSSILYAIEAPGNLRGLLIDAYGADAVEVSPAMLDKLRFRHNA